MVTIPIRTRLQPDGTLDLRVSTGLPESDVEVLIVVQPANSRSSLPAAFFAEPPPPFAEFPLERPAQGALEVRESLR